MLTEILIFHFPGFGRIHRLLNSRSLRSFYRGQCAMIAMLRMSSLFIFIIVIFLFLLTQMRSAHLHQLYKKTKDLLPGP